MEIAVAIGCVGVLFIFGLIHAVCSSCRALNELFSFDVEYNDEIYVKDDEDEAKVRKHQELRLLEKKKAADYFYAATGKWEKPGCLHENFMFDGELVVCGKCKEPVPYTVVSFIGGGGN